MFGLFVPLGHPSLPYLHPPFWMLGHPSAVFLSDLFLTPPKNDSLLEWLPDLTSDFLLQLHTSTWLSGVTSDYSVSPLAAQISCIRQTTPPATPSAHFLLLKPSPGHEYGHVRIKLMNQIRSVMPHITFFPSILWQMPHAVLNCSPPVLTAMPAISPVTAPVLWSAQLLWEEALLPCFQAKSGSSVF